MAVRDYIPLNFDLIANPINWLIIVLMIAVAGLALSLLFPPASTAKD